MFFVTRLKELIIIDGVNYWPHDIEESVETAHPLLRKGCCAVFSVEKGPKESMCIAVEIKRGAVISPSQVISCFVLPYHYKEIEIKHAIQQQVWNSHAISIEPPSIFLVEAGELPKTSSGKLRVSVCVAYPEF